MSDVHIHVPTPGDHYTPATGSATMTVIYELARQHAAFGGETEVIVEQGTRHDYSVGTCREVRFGDSVTRSQAVLDAANGLAGRRRVAGERRYAPAAGAVADDFTGPLIVHNAPAGLRSLARLRPRARPVLYAHNALFRSYRPRELRRTLLSFDRVVCVSEFVANAIAGRCPAAAGVIRVVRNGVDLERFAPSAGEDSGVPVILFVGRVQPYKGPHLLLEAAARLHERGLRFKVKIVGSAGFNALLPLSPYELELRRLAGLVGDDVEFVPFVGRGEIAAEYASASIFCAPATWDEPLGLVIGEAMASGLPVVTTRRGGIPEMGGDSVVYADPADADDLAEQLARLIADPAARAQLGRAARQRVEELSWKTQHAVLLEALS